MSGGAAGFRVGTMSLARSLGLRTMTALLLAIHPGVVMAADPALLPLAPVDLDDDDGDGVEDAQQALLPASAQGDLVPLPAGPVRWPGEAAGVLRAAGRAVEGPGAGESKGLSIQGYRPGRHALLVGGVPLTARFVAARWITPGGKTVSATRGGLEPVRTPPMRLPDDPLERTEENSDHLLLIGHRDDLAGELRLSSLGADGRELDRIEALALREIPCPADLALVTPGTAPAPVAPSPATPGTAPPPGLVCRTTVPIRMALDEVDRDYPVSRGRSIVAELGGRVVASLGGRKLLAARVVGPQEGLATGAIERLRGRLRVFLVRQTPRGGPPFGLTDTQALSLARAQVARTNAIWGQCGVSFGPAATLDLQLVDPPGPSMLAIGCDLGLPAAGGELHFRVDGRPVTVTLPAGFAPREVARRVAGVLATKGLVATVSDNLRISPGALPTSDVLVRRRNGTPALLERPTTGVLSTDRTLSACIGAVDFSDGLQHFTDVDAVAGSVEERALLKAFDDGDSRTIEVIFVPSFATGGRIGESFIVGDHSPLGNMLIEDRAGVRADSISFALAHELGHVLLDVPGHSDDFGRDTPTRLMDSDAADPSAFGPRRLVLAECERAWRQSGPGAPIPLLQPWPIRGPFSR